MQTKDSTAVQVADWAGEYFLLKYVSKYFRFVCISKFFQILYGSDQPAHRRVELTVLIGGSSAATDGPAALSRDAILGVSQCGSQTRDPEQDIEILESLDRPQLCTTKS